MYVCISRLKTMLEIQTILQFFLQITDVMSDY